MNTIPVPEDKRHPKVGGALGGSACLADIINKIYRGESIWSI